MSIYLNLLKTLVGHNRDVNSVAFSRDEKFLASGGGDRTVRIWDVNAKQLVHCLEHGEWVNNVAFAPSGQAVASAGRDGSVKLWNTESGQLIGTIQCHPQNATSLVFSPDGSRLVSGGAEGKIKFFNLREKKMEASVIAHAGWTWRLGLSSLGDRMLSAGGDNVARLWRLGTKEGPLTLAGHEGEVLYACFSPDDRFVATGGKDGTARLWDGESGRQLLSFKGHEGAVNSINFSPDGIHLVTAGVDRAVRVWLTESGKMVSEIEGGYDYISEAVFSRSGKLMASCGGDGSVKIWEVSEKEVSVQTLGLDPAIEFDIERTPNAGVHASTYATGKSLAECMLASGLKISFLQASGERHALAIGDPARTAASIAASELTVLSGDGLPLLKLDLTTLEVTYDRTDGEATPPASECEPPVVAKPDPSLEGETAQAGVPAGAALGDGVELELSGAATSNRYRSFEKLGPSLLRAHTSGGHLVRLVRFAENTVYLLFDDREDPTLIVKKDFMDVRNGAGVTVFRLSLRWMEPVLSSRVQKGEPPPQVPVPRDPLLDTGPLTNLVRDPGGFRLHRILSKAVRAKASDVHVASGAPVLVRLHGRLRPLEGQSFTPQETQSMLLEILTDEQRRRFLETNDLDFSYQIGGVGRFRANVCRQHRGIDGSFRIIAEEIPTPEELGLPASVPPLTRYHQGLILITGPAGQGKSTTIAALVDLINTERPLHVITVEDPVEFIHPVKRAVVNQREVGKHTLSFANALRAALREDPDVIVVGEMRDLETISLAITAAETGHLVFGSLMTTDAAQTVDRILDSFPPGQQAQIRTMLSESLKGIISQQLVPSEIGDWRVLACEVLICNLAVANMIREHKTHQLNSVMQTGRNIGMQRMDDALLDLLQAGHISAENALLYSHDPKAMEARIKPRGPAAVGSQGAARK